MANPAILMAVATGVKMVGQGFSALTKHQSSRYNAALAEQQGIQARRAGSIKGENLQRETEKATGAARAAAGASGLALTGSSGDVIAQIAAEGSQGAATAVYEGLVRGRSFDAQAKAFRRQGRDALIGGAFDILGTGLTGGSKFKMNSGGGGGASLTATGKSGG